MRASNSHKKEECMWASVYPQKTDFLLNANNITEAHMIMMDGKDVLAAEYRKSPVFLSFVFFLPFPSLRAWWITPYFVINIQPHKMSSWQLQGSL